MHPSFTFLWHRLGRAGLAVFALLLLLLPLLGQGQTPVNITTATYSENFDNMAATGTSYVAGWTGIRAAGTGAANATLSPVVDNGASSTGAVFNVGTTSDGDRALGTLASGATVPRFGAVFNNTAGSPITQLVLAGFMEQWKTGSNSTVETCAFEYSLDATSLITGTWTAATGLNLVEKLTSDNTNTAKDGNQAANRTAISATITGLNIADNATFWIRWTDVNDAGSDGMYAIDDFTLTATAGAPPTTTIATGTITGSPFCVGQSGTAVSVPFTSTGTFTMGNVYTAYIGTTAIGTLTSTASFPAGSPGTISATIPSSVASGTTYHIHVDASTPATTGADNSTNLTVVNYQTNKVTGLSAATASGQATLAWTNPASCLSRVVVLARAGSAVTASPTGTFTADAQFGNGTDLGSMANPSQYVVYDGPGAGVTVTGLTNNTQYFFSVFTTNGDGYSTATSTSATPVPPISLSEVLVPQYLVGYPAGGSAHTDRVPYAFRVTLSGLTPSATYRYFNQVINPNDPTDVASTNGSGNDIFPVAAGGFVRSTSPSLATAGDYGQLTADASGSYTGWFILEPTGNARFEAQPGRVLRMRVLLNNGAGGTTVITRVTTTSDVAVRALGTAATAATAVYGRSAAPASNFVLTYDNTAGTGRPLYGTFVESDGTANTTGNSYAPFYATNVEAQAGAWGAITPNDNANGIRYIGQRDLATGAVVGCPATSATGTWPSGTVTASPSGGSTPLALSQTDAPLACDVFVGFNPATVALPEGNTGTTTALMSVTVAGTPASPLTVTVTDTGTGTATAGTDYTFSTQVLTFSAAGTQTVSLTVNGDRLPEPNETVQLSLAASGTPATVTNASATVTILDDDTVLPTLLLEEDFDYPAGTQLASSEMVADATTGFYQNQTTTANSISTAAGNLVGSSYQYPQGAALTATPAGTSTDVSLATSGQDVYKRFVQPAGNKVLYAAALLTVNSAQTGDYFFHFISNAAPGSATTFRGRVNVKAAGAGLFNVGLAVSTETATYNTATAYAIGTTYLFMLKYESSPATGSIDNASLFVLDPTAVPTTEPATPQVGPLTTGTLNSAATLNAIALRQGSGSAAPAFTLDGLRVATTWGPAVGRPGFTTPGGGLNTGNYYDLTLNNGDQVSLNGVVTVENKLVLTSGLLLTDAGNQLVLVPAATVAGGSSTSFVSGPVKRPVGVVANAAGAFTSFTFPVGQAAAYRPLILNVNTQTSNTTYTATQNETPPTQNLTVGDPSGTDLTRVSYRRYFTLTPDAQPTGFVGTVTLSFDTDDFVNSPADASFVVAKRGTTPATWVNIDRSANTGAATTGAPVAGTLTSGSFTSFSDFSLASTSSNGGFPGLNPLPVELTAFSAQRQADKSVSVQWATASERNSARFEVQRSRDGREFATFATAAAQGTSSHATAYAAPDKAAPTGPLYYRLRQVDRDGRTSFSPVAIVAGNGEAARMALYPNPAQSILRFVAATAQAYRVFNQLGQPLLRGTTEAGPAAIAVEALPTGLYFLELQTATGRVVQKFEKE